MPVRTYSSLGNLHSPSISQPSSSTSPPQRLRPALSDNDIAPMPSPNDIQSHLYNAFLSGRTADISLRVRGSWEGTYRFHRVILIQAGFFRSLFDGGFREAASKSSNGEITVTFDDPNITRAAFEICISRLYGGGPALFVDPRLIPSRREPLTSSFPRQAPQNDVPPGQHNATPRFLLSLLATAIYLSIPSVVSQAIQLVLNSLGPHTVVRYLSFAIGNGIGEKNDEEAGAAAGLEHLCQETRRSGAPSIRSKSVRSATSKRSKRSIPVRPDDESPAQKKASAPDNDSLTEDESDSDSMTGTPGQARCNDDADSGGLVFMYGAASNKIGEAASCWLCRWGADMLVYEEAAESHDASGDVGSATPGASTREGTSPTGRRRALTGSQAVGTAVLAAASKENVPLIWRRGGMNAKWARAVLSSDAFFVRDERERYELAKRVVELRRNTSIDPSEEKEWSELFATGIHYMHMAMNDLIDLSQDVSPSIGRTYIPAPVIQAAHWDQSVLRHHISYRQNSSSSSPTTPPRSPPLTRDGNLGLSVTTSEMKEKLIGCLHGAVDANKTYYLVPVDSSSRVGDTTGLEGASMDQLFNSQATPSGPSSKPGTTKGFTSYAPDTFFGILTRPRDATSCVASDPTGQSSWSSFPPIRFAVEFWGLENLQEKSRLTSQTIWYAGSLFNVYVQVVRKKGLQLGMYLHRLSSVETIPIPSSPPMMVASSVMGGGAGTTTNEERRWTTGSVQSVNIPTSSSTPSLYRPASRGTVNTNAPSRSPTPAPSYSPPSTAGTGSSSGSTGLVSTTLQTAIRPPAQPYRDPREAVRAHFTLLCMSPTGGALTRFTSAPDAFLVGRSWGWKSSALQTEELVDVHHDVHAGAGIPTKKECSLRATVVLGVV